MTVRWVLASLLLGACHVPRPEGSFEPADAGDGQSDLGKLFEKKDAAVDARAHDARASIARDAGTTPPETDAGDDDEPMETTDPENPLAGLTGRYLMRMDMYSTAQVKEALSTLRMRSRVSNLLVAEVSLGDSEGRLVSRETLCDQTYAHACEEGCTSWETSLDPGLSAEFFAERNWTRELELDADARTLKGGELTMALGFDEVDGESALPSSTSDARVWMLESDGQERSGVVTQLLGSVPPLSFDCFVSTVARFVTTFSGPLSQQGALSLEHASFDLSTDRSDGRVIWAQGKPASYCSTSQLNAEQGTSSSATDITQTVRLARSEAEGCPSADTFDEALPADPP